MVHLALIQNRCVPLSEQTCYSNNLDEFSAVVLKMNCCPEMFVVQNTSQDRKEHVWYTLLPLKIMPHCCYIKSQCVQTLLIKVHNCKSRLYACMWKMCNALIRYWRVRTSQKSSTSDLNGWIPQISSPASSRCFFSSTAGENSICSHKWPQFPVNVVLMLTLWRGIWKKEGPNSLYIEAQGNLSLACTCGVVCIRLRGYKNVADDSH